MTELDIAKQIATEAHAGQTRRDGTPYIRHPERVAARCKTEQEKAVAWLHDVIEDCPGWTEMKLIESGISKSVALSVFRLSKQTDQSEKMYLISVKGNPLAKTVKIQDMLDNLSDQPTEKQIVRYARSLLFLLE